MRVGTRTQMVAANDHFENELTSTNGIQVITVFQGVGIWLGYQKATLLVLNIEVVLEYAMFLIAGLSNTDCIRCQILLGLGKLSLHSQPKQNTY